MNWNKITTEAHLEEIKKESEQQPILIFKHSTRCSISAMALNRMERAWDDSNDEIKPYFLDLISFRNLSSKVAEDFGVIHESPQVLLIKDGQCIFDASHMGISYNALKSAVVSQ